MDGVCCRLVLRSMRGQNFPGGVEACRVGDVPVNMPSAAPLLWQAVGPLRRGRILPLPPTILSLYGTFPPWNAGWIWCS